MAIEINDYLIVKFADLMNRHGANMSKHLIIPDGEIHYCEDGSYHVIPDKKLQNIAWFKTKKGYFKVKLEDFSIESQLFI